MNFLNIKGKKTQSVLLTVIILNIIAFVLFAGLYTLILKKELAIASVVTEIQKEYVKFEKIKAMKDIVKDTNEERALLDSYFITQDTVVDFIETVEGLGTHAGIDLVLDSVNISSGDNANLSIRVSVEGGWEDILYFLALMESFPARVELNSVGITKATDTENDDYWYGNLYIIVHSFIEM